MGQRILISEEEKKHIKKLYEAETAPPPDESVLVAKKNPFSDDEFKTARKKYNVNLQDGDIFYMLNEEDTKKWILDYMNNNISGKEIRLVANNSTGDDMIYKIEPFIYVRLAVWVPRENDPTNRPSFAYIDTKDTGGYDKVGMQFGINVDMLKKTTTTCYNVRHNRAFPYEHQRTSDCRWIPQDKSFNNNIYQTIEDNLSFNNIPDEYFEIRKIQRRQTDF